MEHYLAVIEPDDNVAGVQLLFWEQCESLRHIFVLRATGILLFHRRNQPGDEFFGGERWNIYEGERAEVPVLAVPERVVPYQFWAYAADLFRVRSFRRHRIYVEVIPVGVPGSVPNPI